MTILQLTIGLAVLLGLAVFAMFVWQRAAASNAADAAARVLGVRS